jgi:hypothetical protein
MYGTMIARATANKQCPDDKTRHNQTFSQWHTAPIVLVWRMFPIGVGLPGGKLSMPTGGGLEKRSYAGPWSAISE